MFCLVRVIVLLVLLFSQATLAWAQPRLSLGTATGYAGEETLLPLALSGGEGKYAGVNARIVLPDGVRLVGVSSGALLSSAFFVEANPASVTVIAYTGADVFSADNGVLLQLHLHVDAQTVPGVYPISFADPGPDPFIQANHALAAAGGMRSVGHTVTNGSLNVRLPPEPVSVTVSVGGGGGTVHGGGSSIPYNALITLTALPDPGWRFSHWTENGQVVSGAGRDYTFQATADRRLMAHFVQIKPLPGVLLLLLDE